MVHPCILVVNKANYQLTYCIQIVSDIDKTTLGEIYLYDL